MTFALFDLAEAIGRWFIWALISAFNTLIAALGAIAAAIWSLLPALPDPLGPPSSQVGNAVAWLFPIGAMVAVGVSAITAYLSFLVVRSILKWVKAL